MAGKVKAVVIDDVAACREYLVEMLADRDYEVATFADARFFVDHCRADKECPVSEPCLDLLVTDNQMPDLNGLDMLVAQFGKGCKLLAKNCAIISGNWSQGDLQQAQSLGCKTFEKPFLGGLNDWLDRLEGVSNSTVS